MSRYGKTYPLGSKEAMNCEKRLDEEYYLNKTIDLCDHQMEDIPDDEGILNKFRLLGMPKRQRN